ncbi:MAG: hypothetical protein EP332_05375 [Bacteroidetes bacterium]|nr:MAG: hypothetical protein EP332_05375 [Bacteroidota bacterium]
MKKRIGILTLLLVWMLSSTAQDKPRVSGYYGKRYLVFGGIEAMGTTQPQKVSQSDGYHLGKTFLIGAQTVVTNRSSLAVRLAYAKTASNYELSSVGADNLMWREGFKHYQLITYRGNAGISIFSLGFEWDLFVKKRGGLSPMGRYLSFGLLKHYNRFDFSDIVFTAQVTHPDISTSMEEVRLSNPTDNTSQFTELFFRYGRVHPINKNLLLDLYGKMGVLLTKIRRPLTSEGKERLSEGLVHINTRRLAYMHVFNLGIRLKFAL